MWYAVETAFIDNKWFGSRCMFDEENEKSRAGTCMASHDEQPMNRTERFFNNRIEIHTDWFESKELAKAFIAGEITYCHLYHTWYDKRIHSTKQKFIRREIIPVDNETGFPHRGRMEYVPQLYKPYWVD